MDKIVISQDELVDSQVEPQQTPRVEAKLAPAIPWWTRAALAPLVFVLPLLCLITIVLRVAFRSQPPRTRHAWTSYLSTLLIVSGILTSMATVVLFSLGPIPAIVSTGLADLDERTDYPKLPSTTSLSGADVSHNLKSLVAVISPAAQSLFGKREMLSMSFGAGMLLQSNAAGYLFATARHVVGNSAAIAAKTPHAMLSLESGVWSTADVIAIHKDLDLALIWVSRHSGEASFLQPIAGARQGEEIFVIGHPEGLKFTLSSGIVSRLENSILQVSAPISPGNSGGPVYDHQGNLVGIVSSTLDKTLRPNAENLNFAIAAEALLREPGWQFAPGGREHLAQFWRDSKTALANQPAAASAASPAHAGR
ncbi:MAG: serine protease [Acidobacteriota bacterium]|nr:serine protease [Acidobacteriota bacterium]